MKKGRGKGVTCIGLILLSVLRMRGQRRGGHVVNFSSVRLEARWFEFGSNSWCCFILENNRKPALGWKLCFYSFRNSCKFTMDEFPKNKEKHSKKSEVTRNSNLQFVLQQQFVILLGFHSCFYNTLKTENVSVLLNTRHLLHQRHQACQYVSENR